MSESTSVRSKELEVLIVTAAFCQSDTDQWLQSMEPDQVPKTVENEEALFYWIYSTIFRKGSFYLYLFPDRDLVEIRLDSRRFMVKVSDLMNHKDFRECCVKLSYSLNKEIKKRKLK